MASTGDAFLIATFAQAILYGLYLVTFVQCLRWLLYEDEAWKLRTCKTVNRVMLIIATLLLSFQSVDTMVTIKISLTQLGSGNRTGLGDELGIMNVRVCQKRKSWVH
jgi:hypothetical protein